MTPKPFSEPLCNCMISSSGYMYRLHMPNCPNAQPEAAASVPKAFHMPRFHDADFDAARAWVLAKFPDFEKSESCPKGLLYYLMGKYRTEPSRHPDQTRQVFIWSCAVCRNRVQTHTNFHINERPICCQCNAEMEPQKFPLSMAGNGQTDAVGEAGNSEAEQSAPSLNSSTGGPGQLAPVNVGDSSGSPSFLGHPDQTFMSAEEMVSHGHS